MSDLISRKAAIEAVCRMMHDCFGSGDEEMDAIAVTLNELPSAQPEIIHCKECKYGVQDEDERWYCRGFGCQVGEEDGSGFCADAERRTDGN